LLGYGAFDDFNYIVIELLGPNLLDLFEYCNQTFSLQTVLLLTIEILSRIEDLHERNYIHKDIKPENFVIGIHEKSNQIYIIDFGLAKKYRDGLYDHIPYREKKPLTGTARYASINSHMGIEQSRRDDLESIGYLMVYFIKKQLPWQGCVVSKEKYNKILDKKLLIPAEVLCKGLPSNINLLNIINFS